jgi:hypothetical protein
MKAMLLSLGVGLALTASASPLAAQTQHCDAAIPGGGTAPTCGMSVPTSVTVPSILSLDLDRSLQSLTAPTSTSYGAGGNAAIQDAGPVASVKANRNWSLAINTAQTNFTYTPPAGGTATPSKPVGDLRWTSVAGGGTCPASPLVYGNQLSTTGGGIATGSATNSTVRQMCYLTQYSLLGDPAGGYAVTITYTVTGT